MTLSTWISRKHLTRESSPPPGKQAAALQSSLAARSKWEENGELIINPSKRNHLPVGDTSKSVTYAFISHTKPYVQPIQTVSTVRCLGLFLNAGISADDNVARATKKNRIMFLYLKQSFANLTPSIFLLL